MAQARASDHGAAAYVDPSASLVTRPELPGTQLARTPSTVTVNLSCQHDGAVTGIYIDPSAVVLAEPTGALS